MATGTIDLAAFRNARAADKGTSTPAPSTSKASVTPAVESKGATRILNAKMLRAHIDEVSGSIKAAVTTLKELGITADFYGLRMRDTLSRCEKVLADFSLDKAILSGDIRLTAAQVEGKDRLMAELEEHEQFIYKAVELAVVRGQLRRWLESTKADMPSERLGLAPGIANAYLIQASDFVRYGRHHISTCASSLYTAELALAQGRLPDARVALSKVDDCAVIFRAVKKAVAAGELVVNAA